MLQSRSEWWGVGGGAAGDGYRSSFRAMSSSDDIIALVTVLRLCIGGVEHVGCDTVSKPASVW